MRGITARLNRLESELERQDHDQRPEFSDEALSTWSTCVAISDLVHNTYAGDRDLALSDFASWPADLKTRSNSFCWQLKAHIGPLFPADMSWLTWQELLSNFLDFYIGQGVPVEDLRQAEALSQAISVVVEAAEILGDYNGNTNEVPASRDATI